MELQGNITSRIIPVLLLGSILLIVPFPFLTEVMAQDLIPYWPEPSQVELHYRRENGISYIDVAVTFPTTRYDVSDWGTPSLIPFLNSSWEVDAEMWYGLYGIDCPMVLDHSYDLGHPQAGEYDFYFRVWGMPIKAVYGFSVSYILGDVNRDGVVDVFDLSVVGQSYGLFSWMPGYNPQADITDDGLVDALDLAVVTMHWGESDP